MDFYKFVLKKRTNLKIAFSHEPINSDYTFGTVRLYSEESGGSIPDNEENETIYIHGDSAKNVSSSWRSLPAGTYYVKIERYGSFFMLLQALILQLRCILLQNSPEEFFLLTHHI